MNQKTRFRMTLAGLLVTVFGSLTLGTHLVDDGTLRAVDLVFLFGGGMAAGAAIALLTVQRRRRRSKR